MKNKLNWFFGKKSNFATVNRALKNIKEKKLIKLFFSSNEQVHDKVTKSILHQFLLLKALSLKPMPSS